MTETDPWLTRKQLFHIYDKVKDRPVGERINLNNLADWRGEPQPLYMAFYLALHRTTNILQRRNMDHSADRWFVLSPATAECGILPEYMFGEYTTPGKSGGKWIKTKGWREIVREETSPGVHYLGALCCAWRIYVLEDFPDNVVLAGLGGREVVHYRPTGKMVKEVLNEGTEHEYRYEHPEIEPYMGPPTVKHYSIIKLEHGDTVLNYAI